jgi:hypothetical protein
MELLSVIKSRNYIGKQNKLKEEENETEFASQEIDTKPQEHEGGKEKQSLV